MERKILNSVLVVIMAGTVFISCNNGMGSHGSGVSDKNKIDRSQRTVIDSAEYIDFTIQKYNAANYKKSDILFYLGDKTFKNGNSYIKLNRKEGTIEINSDKGYYNGKNDCQIYGIFYFDITAANNDCLYIRSDPGKEGTLLIDNVTFKNDQIPDLTVCIPLYGFSNNRIEVSSIMNGFIVMPSGTYWVR